MNREKTYQWLNEYIDARLGILETTLTGTHKVWSNSVKDLKLPSKTKDKYGHNIALLLMVDVREDDKIVEQQWAYVRDGKLPSHFRKDCFERGLSVPGRFQAELCEYIDSKL